MNTETGQIKKFGELTKDEVIGGKWVGISEDDAKLLEPMTAGERLDWWERQKASNPDGVAATIKPGDLPEEPEGDSENQTEGPAAVKLTNEQFEQLDADLKAWLAVWNNPNVAEAFRAGFEARERRLQADAEKSDVPE